jgi:hypothetical protein
VLSLQHTAGNRAVSTLLRSQGAGPPPLQAKLIVGAPNDRFEQEADRIADQLAETRGQDTSHSPGDNPQGPVSGVSRQRPGVLRRQPLDDDERVTIEEEPSVEDVGPEFDLTDAEIPEAEDPDDERRLLQAKPEPGAAAEAPPGLVTRLASLRGRGRPLPAPQRDALEPHFGHDFGQVRVHIGNQAAELARSVRARAFTVGNDVVFGAGEYRPESQAGQQLLAHELTHVVQQAGGSSTTSFSPTGASGESARLTGSGIVQQHAGIQLQRQPTDEEKQTAAVEATLKASLEKTDAILNMAGARLSRLTGGALDPELIDVVRDQGEAAKEDLDLLVAFLPTLAALPEKERNRTLNLFVIELEQFVINTDHLLVLNRVVNVKVPDVFENKEEADGHLADFAEWHEEWIDANIDVGEFASDWLAVQLELEEQTEVAEPIFENLKDYESRSQQQAKALADVTNWVNDLEAEIQQKKMGAKILRVLEKVDEVLSYIPGKRGRGRRRARKPKRTRRTKADRAKASKGRRQKRAERRKKRKENKAERIRRGIRRLLKSPFFRRGPYAREGGSTRASNPDSVPADDQRAVNEAGRKFGDHHTGAKRPGTSSGNWIGDHMPVTELVRTAQRDGELRTMMTAERLPTNLDNQRLYPHSLKSARIQGGTVRAVQSKLEALARAKARR